MTYIIELDEDGTFTLIYEDDTALQTQSIEEIFHEIRLDLAKSHNKSVQTPTIEKLFDL